MTIKLQPTKQPKFCKECHIQVGYRTKTFLCSSCGNLKELNSNYRHGLTFNKKCKCGKPISYYNKRCWSCWKKEISVLYLGENNPAWNGGTSFTPYPIGWNKTFKEQIRLRDKYKCQLCGKPEAENIRTLAVHHIDYHKENITSNNLITLCQQCHSKTNTHRQYWRHFFVLFVVNKWRLNAGVVKTDKTEVS
jgi:hypothetical protein